jgi:hypothetical protein
MDMAISQNTLMKSWVFIIFSIIYRSINIFKKNHNMTIFCLTAALHQANV